jgi:hypothetical protein
MEKPGPKKPWLFYLSKGPQSLDYAERILILTSVGRSFQCGNRADKQCRGGRNHFGSGL